MICMLYNINPYILKTHSMKRAFSFLTYFASNSNNLISFHFAGI